MSPLTPEPSRRRGALVVLIATIALVSALIPQNPVFGQSAEEYDEEAGLTEEGVVVQPPVGDDTAPKVTSLTSAIPADSGVSVQTLCTNCNNANLSIAGFGNEHISLICDGLVVPSGLAQIYLLSVMPPTRIDKIDVDKGASDAALVGSAIGGGIKVQRTKPKEGVTLNASADAGSYGWGAARVDVTGRSGWFGGYFVGTYAESEAIDANLDGWADLPEFQRHTMEVGFDLTPGDAHRLRFGFGRYNEDQWDGPANAVVFDLRSCVGYDQVIGYEPCTNSEEVAYNREDVQLNREQFDLNYDFSLGNGAKLSVAAATAERKQNIQETDYSVQQSQNVFLPGDEQRLMDEFGLTVDELCSIYGICVGPLSLVPEGYIPAYKIDDVNRQAAVGFSKPIGQEAMFRVGLLGHSSDFEVVDARFNAARGMDFPQDFQLKEDVTEVGAWAEFESALGSRVEFLVGLRYTDYTYHDNEAELNELLGGSREDWLAVPMPEGSEMLPRAALTWKALDSLQFRFSGGAGLRAPAPAFDKVCCGRQYRGNRGLDLEDSWTYGFEATYEPGPRWRVGFSAFHSDFNNQIINIASDSEEYRNTYQNVNMSESRNRSVTLEGKFQAPIWLTTRASFTLLDPENLTPGGEIVALFDTNDEPEPRYFYYDGVPYTTDRRGALGFDFNLPPQAALSLNVAYTGPTLIQQFNRNPAPPVYGIEPDLAEAEDFWMANVRFSKSFRSGMTIYAGIDNVLGYVQGDGCTADDVELNPDLVGCLGDPRFDFNWGPLRGRYYYAGLGYQFVH